ncbi:MAG: hypothetical protein IJT23_00610 [Clostridia bacterium]|nr:hypothetical protein [Clostridia bacterium]
MNFKKIVSAVSALAISVSAFAGLAVTASAESTSVEQTLTSQAAILGTNVVNSHGVDDIYVNSYAGNGGAAALGFELDSSFNPALVESATLSLYVSKQANKGRTGDINFYGLSAMPTASSITSSTLIEDYPKAVFSQGGANTKRYTYSGTAVATVTHSALNNTYMKTGQYNDVDLTSYIKSISEGTTDVYLGISISDFAADTSIAGMGTENEPKLTIVYSSETVYSVAFSGLPSGSTVTVNGVDATNGIGLVAGTYTYTATAVGYEDKTDTFTVVDADVTVPVSMTAKAPAGAVTVKYMNGADEIVGAAVPTVDVAGKYVGDTATYYYPKYINVDGTWYATTETSYGKTVALTANAQESTVAYAPASDTIIAFVEGEDATAVNPSGGSGYGRNSSDGERFSSGHGVTVQKSGVNAYFTVTVNIPADGNYTFAGPLYNNNNRDRSVDIFVDGLPNGDDVADFSDTISGNGGTGSFSIDKDLTAGEHTFAFAATNTLSPVFDYVVITQNSVKTPATASVSATSAINEGYITFKGVIANVDDLTTVTKAGFGFVNLSDAVGSKDLQALWTTNAVQGTTFGAAIEQQTGAIKSDFYGIPYIVIGDEAIFGTIVASEWNE